MPPEQPPPPVSPAPTQIPWIRRLTIERFRGIRSLTWLPGPGLNLILGGGDVGKSTILDALSLLLSPTYPTTVSDTDYYGRAVQDGFTIEGVLSLPPETGIHDQLKHCWPWHWNGEDVLVPSLDGEDAPGDPVYQLRVRGTEDLELVYEIVQPDGTATSLTVGLRRKIGLVRLGGDDRSDRDLRLIHGSALDRLLSDPALRSRLTRALSDSNVRQELSEDAQTALSDLDRAFTERHLPAGLSLGIVGRPGASIAAMVGLTSKRADFVQALPLATWGAGTQRIAALAIAQQGQSRSPITVVDELERGLEPYRQRRLVHTIHEAGVQSFATTHSPFVISASSVAALWHLGPRSIGRLDPARTARARTGDPKMFLSRLSVVCEGDTEVGFVAALLERALDSSIDDLGIHIHGAGGHEDALGLLEALTQANLFFAGFADNEAGKYPERWRALHDSLGPLLFRWPSSCTEETLIRSTPAERLRDLLTDPADDKTGERLRTLADRLGMDAKDFDSLAARAGSGLAEVMIAAATGSVPPNSELTRDTAKHYRKHGQRWFKSIEGGRELEAKLFTLHIWPALKDPLLAFCNAVLRAVGQPPRQDLPHER